MTRRRFIQTADGFVEVPVHASSRASVAPSIRTDVDPFRSPIDGSIIRTRKQLDEHNRRHGVSNDLDSLREKTQQQLQRQANPALRTKKERLNSIVEAVNKVEQGYRPPPTPEIEQ